MDEKMPTPALSHISCSHLRSSTATFPRWRTNEYVPSAAKRPRPARRTTRTTAASAATAVGRSSGGQIRGRKRPFISAKQVRRKLCAPRVWTSLTLFAGLIKDSSQFFYYPSCLKKWNPLQKWEKWPENNQLASCARVKSKSTIPFEHQM